VIPLRSAAAGRQIEAATLLSFGPPKFPGASLACGDCRPRLRPVCVRLDATLDLIVFRRRRFACRAPGPCRDCVLLKIFAFLPRLFCALQRGAYRHSFPFDQSRRLLCAARPCHAVHLEAMPPIYFECLPQGRGQPGSSNA
jgi:hypothetical protein